MANCVVCVFFNLQGTLISKVCESQAHPVLKFWGTFVFVYYEFIDENLSNKV